MNNAVHGYEVATVKKCVTQYKKADSTACSSPPPFHYDLRDSMSTSLTTVFEIYSSTVKCQELMTHKTTPLLWKQV